MISAPLLAEQLGPIPAIRGSFSTTSARCLNRFERRMTVCRMLSKRSRGRQLSLLDALDLEVILIGPGEREEFVGYIQSGPSIFAGYDANVDRRAGSREQRLTRLHLLQRACAFQVMRYREGALERHDIVLDADIECLCVDADEQDFFAPVTADLFDKVTIDLEEHRLAEYGAMRLAACARREVIAAVARRDPADGGVELQIVGPDTRHLRDLIPFLGSEFDGVLERNGETVGRRQGRCGKRRTEGKRQPVYHKSRAHSLCHPVRRR